MTDLVRIPFHGSDLLAVDINGKPHIILRPALERLGVDYSNQLKKLKAKSWAHVVPSTTQDQFRDMATVDVRTFLMLLATIDEHRVREDIRPVLVAYQNEVEPDIDLARRPLTVGEYLGDRGVTGAALRSLSPKLGVRIKALYVSRYGRAPLKVDRFVDGALRPVYGYTEADRPLFDQARAALNSEAA